MGLIGMNRRPPARGSRHAGTLGGSGTLPVTGAFDATGSYATLAGSGTLITQGTSTVNLANTANAYLTLTGGMTFAGGPLNNYTTHGVATMVSRSFGSSSTTSTRRPGRCSPLGGRTGMRGDHVSWSLTSGNTNAPCMMIGEKCAQMALSAS